MQEHSNQRGEVRRSTPHKRRKSTRNARPAAGNTQQSPGTTHTQPFSVIASTGNPHTPRITTRPPLGNARPGSTVMHPTFFNPHGRSEVSISSLPSSTPIPYSILYMNLLHEHVQPAAVMQKQGYTTQPLTEYELQQKRRCLGCGKNMAQIAKLKLNPQDKGKDVKKGPSPTGTTSTSPFQGDQKRIVEEPPKVVCEFHSGEVFNRQWTCCGQRPSSPPCDGSATHNIRNYAPHELERLYQFHITPLQPPARHDIRAAVAIDCEMGTAASGDSELIRITLIDYFTSLVLVDNLVEPDVPMAHLNTRFSGVTFADIRKAKREGRCLYGRAAAMKEVWRFVGPSTIVVGHGASNDFRVLKWLHANVVDSQVIERARLKKRMDAEADNELAKKLGGVIIGADGDMASGTGMENNQEEEEEEEDESFTATIRGVVVKVDEVPKALAEPKRKKPKGTGDLALKTLAKKYLERDIQKSNKLGHDSLEDAVAARDVVHCLIWNPE